MTYNNTVPWNVAFGLVAVSIVVCNLFFLFAFFKNNRLRRMRTNLFFIGLTAADLIVGTVAIPMYMAILWPGSEAANSKAFKRSYLMIEIVSSFASLFVLAVIALERVYSVFWPYKHRTLSKTPYYFGLIASWFLAVLQLIFHVLHWQGVIMSKEYFYSFSASMTAIVIVIAVSYIAMWMKLKTNRVEGFHQKRVEQERNLAKTLAILTGICLITWLPFHVVMALVTFDRELNVPSIDHLVYAAKLLHYSNSLANPVVYSFRLPEVRRTLVEIFCRREQIIAPVEMTTRRLSAGDGRVARICMIQQ